jgi:hypothetical protein
MATYAMGRVETVGYFSRQVVKPECAVLVTGSFDTPNG